MRISEPPPGATPQIPDGMRPALVGVAKRVFWWGTPDDWLDDPIRFAAQVMTYGDWDDTALVLNILGDSIFQQVLADPPAGVFDPKSWHYWHRRYSLDVPPLPHRRL